jgi:hypothetical protein
MKKVVFLESKRDAYNPNDCYCTLTVQELIDSLSDLEPDALVYLRHDNGYSYGAISDCRIREASIDGDGNEVGGDDYDPDNEIEFE